MTWITVVTVGYGEIIDLSHNPAAGSSRCSSAPRHRQHLVFDVQLTVFIVETFDES